MQFGDVASWRAKVHEDPGNENTHLRHVLDHDELVLVDVHLLLFGPPLVFSAVVALLRFRAELGQENRFLRKRPLEVWSAIDDPQEYLIHDVRFHRAIAEAAGNPILTVLMETVVSAITKIASGRWNSPLT